MVDERLQLPDDVAALQELVRSQARHYEEQLNQGKALLRQRESTIEQLQERIHLLLSARFGASSEKVSDAQLGLFNEAEETHEDEDEDEASAAEIEVPAHRRARAKRKPLPADLPRVVVVHDLAEEDKVCPHDGTRLVLMGEGMFEQSEQLDIIPAQLRVLVHQRLKYRCPCCQGHIKTAPMTAQPIPKSLASPGLLAYIATAKFVDALPLYRQVAQFERIGISMSRATMASWMIRCGTLLTPLINLLREALHESGHIHMDETTLQVLKEPGQSPPSKSYLWAQCNGEPSRPIVLFDYDSSRSGEVPRRLLEGFEGILQTDAYAGYNGVVREQGLTRLLCWAHARRHLVEVIKAAGVNPNKLPPKPPDKLRRALKALNFIKTLYAIERRLRDKPPEERYRVRQAESVPVLDKLRAWLDEMRPKVTPKSKLGEALAYLHNHWRGLIAYCDDGRYHIDNNAVENAIRPFCIGRRGWLFSDTPAGATASARLYSLVQTAKANRLEPYAYLRHVFTELPKAQSLQDIEALLPYNVDPAALRIDNHLNRRY